MLPSLERLRELIRACGLELMFGIANADLEEHDLTLIRRALSKSPRERFDANEHDARAFFELWANATPVARA